MIDLKRPEDIGVLQDSELDAVSGGTAVEYTVMLALIILVCCGK